MSTLRFAVDHEHDGTRYRRGASADHLSALAIALLLRLRVIRAAEAAFVIIQPGPEENANAEPNPHQ